MALFVICFHSKEDLDYKIRVFEEYFKGFSPAFICSAFQPEKRFLIICFLLCLATNLIMYFILRRRKNMKIFKLTALLLAAFMGFSMVKTTSFAEEAKAEAATEAEEFTGLGVVHTAFGDVEGILGTREKVTVFKGVPYAAPPVGDLRWAEPVDPEPWEGVLACDTYAPAAMQPNYTINSMVPGSNFYPAGRPPMSEDCLYLNITTPAVSADEKLPVMIWFHGGGLSHGYSWQVPFEGEDLASEGVIVVTVGHRLNIMGYLCLPQLTAVGSCGNYGLMDCIKSVEWVYDNIAAFGGDPEKIMVFGQSGGGVKVAAAVAAPQTQGKIAAFAAQSAFSLFGGAGEDAGLTTLEQNEQAGLAFLDAIGVSRDATLEELRAIPIEKMYDPSIGYANASGVNVIDGKYVTQNYSDFFLGEGNLDGIAMMAGYVFPERGTYGAETPEELYDMIRAEFGDELFEKYDIANTVPITKSNLTYMNYKLKQDVSLDEIRLYAKVKAERNEDSPSYIYSFGRVTPDKDLGWHSGELWYLFNNMGYSFEGLDDSWQPKWEVYDYMVGDLTAAYWSNFAGTGDPNAPGLAFWPEANAEEQPYQYIDVVSTSYDVTPFDEMVMEYYANRYGIYEEAE